MEMSSSRASQWSPRLLMRSCSRCSGVVRRRRENQARRGAEGSSVAEVDRHAVGVEADIHRGCGCANRRIHSMLSKNPTSQQQGCGAPGLVLNLDLGHPPVVPIIQAARTSRVHWDSELRARILSSAKKAAGLHLDVRLHTLASDRVGQSPGCY